MNSELKAAAQSALSRDPRVTQPTGIAISADEIGSVTLHGTVESFPRLCWDTHIPAGQIDIEVAHGRLTITSEVDHEFESERVHRDVSQLTGVVGFANEIKVKTPRPADELWR
jgi:BON domain